MRTSTIHTILYECGSCKALFLSVGGKQLFFKNVFIIDLIRREYQILLQSLQ